MEKEGKSGEGTWGLGESGPPAVRAHVHGALSSDQPHLGLSVNTGACTLRRRSVIPSPRPWGDGESLYGSGGSWTP